MQQSGQRGHAAIPTAISADSFAAVAGRISLEGRRAVVTGGARGIGLAVARLFAAAGASVLIGDLDEAAAQAASGVAPSGGTLLGCRLDCRDAASVEACGALAQQAFGGVDIWVNNAGIYPSAPLAAMSEAMWDAVSDINLKGVFLGCREALRRITAGPSTNPVIINMASTAGLRGRAGLSHYSATKHGVVGLTRSLAAELGPQGIRVLAIAPTLVETPGVAQRREDEAPRTTAGATVDAAVAATIPLGRIGRPEDVAGVALFCASDLASFMTGATLPVDGGALAALF